MAPAPSSHRWPGEALTRVPYWVYQDEETYREELRRIFEGPVWILSSGRGLETKRRKFCDAKRRWLFVKGDRFRPTRWRCLY